MYEEFVRERITQLRLKKGVSEYKMSYDLGHSRGYVYNISSGKALPPLKEFFAICDYFELSPMEFFEGMAPGTRAFESILDDLKQLSFEDRQLVTELITRLKK